MVRSVLGLHGSQCTNNVFDRAQGVDILIRNKSGRQQVWCCGSAGNGITTEALLAGGWWARPSNWKSNTAIVFSGILAISYGVFSISAAKEVRACRLCLKMFG